jgi:hypothetical protein
MHEAAVSPLSAWEGFYVILGSAAAVLTGLMFVVITLMSEAPARRSSQAIERGIAAFSTPTVVHFCLVLLVSVILSAPWPALSTAGLMLGLSGLAGVTYAGIVVRRLRRQTGYRPEWDDWLWYGIVPLAAYIALVVAAMLLPGSPEPALFGIGAVAVLLLFLGLRNTWDVLTYVALSRLQNASQD